MEAQVGLEPTTCRLQGGRTTNCAIKPYNARAQPLAAEDFLWSSPNLSAPVLSYYELGGETISRRPRIRYLYCGGLSVSARSRYYLTSLSASYLTTINVFKPSTNKYILPIAM